jgi:hypothetical protein
MFIDDLICSPDVVLPLAQPSSAPTPLLQHLSFLLSLPHDSTRRISPPLSTILLSVSEHLLDEDTARIPGVMREQNDLSPTAPDWLSSWESLLEARVVKSQCALQTKRVCEDEFFAYKVNF